MDFYGCLYFDSDKSVSVVPRSRCVLRVPFEAGNEAEVSWRCDGEKQRFIGTILKTAKKDQKEQIDQFAIMADRSIDQWLKSGEDVKAKLAVLIATPFPVNAGADEATDETNAKNPRKRIRKETAIMQESKEQEKSEKGPATKKKKKDDNLVEDRVAKTQEKHHKKASSKSKADKSKETRTHLTNLANKSAAESEASVNAAKDIFNTFKGAFSRASKQTDQVSGMVTLDLDDSDEEGQTNVETAGEVSLSTTDPVQQQKAVPLRLGQTHFQQQITPLTLPPRPAVPVTPLIGIGQEILPQSQSVVSTSRAATSLLETADALAEVRAMSSQLGGDEDCYPPGGFREFLARPLNHDSSQDRKEIIELLEENSRLRDEIAILKSKLISSARNQPVPSAEVLQYMRDVLALNTVDGTELLPEVADVPTQQYTIRANLEPRVSQTPNDAVKLLEKSDVVVNRNTLRSVVQSGHAKGALHLLKKLIPLVFSTEELGNSCGQGIGKGGKTNNDGKRPLSQHKVNTCKDYITAFCIQNGKDHPSEKDINQAFTQQVTYARTKLNINQTASASSS